MLNTNRLNCRTAASTSRGGFTLVELLVVIGIIAILAGVALGPITRGIKQAQESTSVQVAHQLGALEFAYSNDYNQTYPYVSTKKSEDLASLLMNGGYASNPNIFYVANTPGATKSTGATAGVWTLTAPQVNWDFTQAATAGLTSSTSDQTPLCQLTGSTVTTLATTGTTALTINTAKTAFGADGIAVYYKGNNAKFVKTAANGAATATDSSNTTSPWIDSNYNDANAGTYAFCIP